MLLSLCCKCCIETIIGKEKVIVLKNIHVMVATAAWGQDQLRYRRHRLAEFLYQQPNTEEVIWLCPTPLKTDQSFRQLPNGIKEWKIQDINPRKIFRFGRYLDLCYQQKLRSLLLYLNQLESHYKLFLWYTFPGFPKLGEMMFWDKVVYDCSDLWASPVNGKNSFLSQIRQKIIRKAENRIIKSADPIFCTSDYLREEIVQKCKPDLASHVYTHENGVEFSLFTKNVKAEDVLSADFRGTVFGYIGGIKPKLDFQLVQKAARKRRDCLFLFVGPDWMNQSSEFHQLLNENNVRWTGSVSPFDVPKYMNRIDIGMMPYKPSPYNEAVFPLKLFEFLAAGKPVIGMHLPSTKKYQREGVYIHLETNDPESFLNAAEQMEKDKDKECFIAARIQLAKTRDWQDIFHNMVKNL